MLDTATLDRLRVLLEREGVRVAHLFGSAARGNEGPLSDVDLAVLYGQPLSADEAFDRTLALLSRASSLFDWRLDVVVLDAAPPELKYAVIGEGVVLLNLDNALRVAFEARTVSEYRDTEYMRRAQRMYLYDQLAGGPCGDAAAGTRPTER